MGLLAVRVDEVEPARRRRWTRPGVLAAATPSEGASSPSTPSRDSGPGLPRPRTQAQATGEATLRVAQQRHPRGMKGGGLGSRARKDPWPRGREVTTPGHPTSTEAGGPSALARKHPPHHRRAESGPYLMERGRPWTPAGRVREARRNGPTRGVAATSTPTKSKARTKKTPARRAGDRPCRSPQAEGALRSGLAPDPPSPRPSSQQSEMERSSASASASVSIPQIQAAPAAPRARPWTPQSDGPRG